MLVDVSVLSTIESLVDVRFVSRYAPVLLP